MVPLKRYKITILFMPNPKTGKAAPLIDMTLKTKPVTEKRMHEVVEMHADDVWPYWSYSWDELPGKKTR